MTSDTLLTRGAEKVIPEDLARRQLASGEKLRVYLGIDPTGAKLHLGHSVPLRKLQKFADAGHHAIFLVGSFTAMIGDPSGRDTQREPMTQEEVEENFQTYKKQASRILDFEAVEVVYNHMWLEKLTPTEILKLASHFTKQQFAQRDMFVRREKEGKPIHLHEFLYPLLVGYDSAVLDVDCELGGSDQEFNMLVGKSLQKAYGKREKFVLTTKLIEGTDGRKMSKTYGNCVYLEDPPEEMFGKLMSIKDELIPTYAECCTDLPPVMLSEVEASPKERKLALAREIVRIYYGENAADRAQKEFEAVFARKGTPEDMLEVTVKKGTALIDALVKENIVASKSEAKRLIEQRGITVNDVAVTSPEEKVKEGVVKVGKRRFLRIFVHEF